MSTTTMTEQRRKVKQTEDAATAMLGIIWQALVVYNQGDSGAFRDEAREIFYDADMLLDALAERIADKLRSQP